MTRHAMGLAFAALLSTTALMAQTPQGTAFTHQGRLTENGSPATGLYDFEFRLFDAPSAGGAVGPVVTRNDVAVSNGLFTTTLDFGAVFAGSKRWLEISVRPGASTGAYTLVSPRQELTSAPASLFSAIVPWTGVSGKPPGFADDVDNDSGGTVTSVTTGAGLSGGTITTSGTIAVNFGGGGTATLVARSDHIHLAQVWNGSTGTAAGLRVQSSTATGLYGVSSAALGGDGVRGETSSSDGGGVSGFNLSSVGHGYGVYGQSSSTESAAVGGFSFSTTGFAVGVSGRSESSSGTGVSGLVTAATGFVRGVSGVVESTEGIGVEGVAISTTGQTRGVFGRNASTAGAGVEGYAQSTSGTANGVSARTEARDGFAVYAVATSSTGNASGVWGETNSSTGNGVIGASYATTGFTAGVLGTTNSTSGYGVHGLSGSTIGFAPAVQGDSVSTSGVGVFGISRATTGFTRGVYGESQSTMGLALYGRSTSTSGNGVGVWGEANSPTGEAGHFQGNVVVTGTLSKGGGSFKIDHPLDPENKYLYHSFVESPDMMNIYNGNVTTDSQGFARVDLPEWFEALNRDFRYQLTVLGDGAWARARVFQKVEGGTFVIQTDLPGAEVSWQVTGIRHDPFAEAHRIPVEQDKPEGERGTYLHPSEWGQDAEKSVDRQRKGIQPDVQRP